jgi:hypothetical protein
MAKGAVQVLNDNLTDEDSSETEAYFRNEIITSTDNIGKSITNKDTSMDQKIFSKVLDCQIEFNEMLLEVIEEVLHSLGEPVKNSLLINFQNKYGIKKEEIPEKIGDFSLALHNIFGHLGAIRLEKRFVKNLNTKIIATCNIAECKSVVDLVINDWTFKDYVIEIRQKFVDQKSSSPV